MMRRRRGYSVIEVLVVIAIALAVIAVSIPAVNSIFGLEQRRAAKELALTYGLLQNEAILRNVTFRIAYHLDANYYEVEVGSAGTLIFADPEQREAHEAALASKLSRHEDEEGMEPESDFTAVATRFRTKVELPRGTVFGGVYTPQYGELVEPSGAGDDPDQPLIVYSYLFPNGFAEPTVVQLVESKNPDAGFTIIVQPLSGEVTLSGELLDPEDVFEDLPLEGPRLPT